jgi:hypothetical protein
MSSGLFSNLSIYRIAGWRASIAHFLFVSKLFQMNQLGAKPNRGGVDNAKMAGKAEFNLW